MISQNRGGIGNPNHDEKGRFAKKAYDAMQHSERLSRKQKTLSELERYDFFDKRYWSDKNIRYYIDENLSMPLVMKHSDKIKRMLKRDNLTVNNDDDLDKMGIDIFGYNELNIDNTDFIDVKTTYGDGIQLPFINVEPDKNKNWHMHKGLLIADESNFKVGETKYTNQYLLNFLTQYEKMDNRTKAQLIKRYGADEFANCFINNQELYSLNKKELFGLVYKVASFNGLTKIHSTILSKFDQNGTCIDGFDNFMRCFNDKVFTKKNKGDFIEISAPLGQGLTMIGKIYPNKPFFDLHMNIKVDKSLIQQQYGDRLLTNE